jgi:hypothetical protein
MHQKAVGVLLTKAPDRCPGYLRVFGVSSVFSVFRLLPKGGTGSIFTPILMAGDRLCRYIEREHSTPDEA